MLVLSGHYGSQKSDSVPLNPWKSFEIIAQYPRLVTSTQTPHPDYYLAPEPQKSFE